MADDVRVLERLDRLVRLVAAGLASQAPRRHDQMVLLTKAGFRPKEIAELLGTTANAISVELSKLRRQGRLRLPGAAERATVKRNSGEGA